ncbi:MAG: DUF6048 family protein [Clostridium sp.]|nr:DUF6048 family protein [Clostridium sp.]
MGPRIFKYFSIALISLFPFNLSAQEQKTPQSEQEARQAVADPTIRPVPLYCGVSVFVDVAGAAMKVFNADFAQMEVAARVSLKDRFFPIVEAGYGSCDYVHEETYNTFKTNAPYFRVGMDYSFNKKKRTGNRVYAGLRYGFSAFRYDISSPDFRDPVWNVEVPFRFENLKANAQWGEVLFGVETKIWKYFHLGWTVRYKFRMKNATSPYGEAWYIPGFGKNDTSCLGGTFCAIFEI